jgi:hypothetical protein
VVVGGATGAEVGLILFGAGVDHAISRASSNQLLLSLVRLVGALLPRGGGQTLFSHNVRRHAHALVLVQISLRNAVFLVTAVD